MKFIYVALILCYGVSLFSQKKYLIKDIDIISFGMTNNNVNFYKKIDDNTFKQLTVNEDEDNFKLIFTINDDVIPKEDVFYEDNLTFSINDLQKIKPKNLLKQRKLFELNERYSYTYKIVSTINNHILAVNPIYFGKQRFGVGEGAVSTYLPDDKEEKWRSDYADFFEIVAIQLKNKKYIYFLFDEYFNLSGYIIPYKNATYLSYSNEGFIKLPQIETSISFNYNESLESFFVSDIYQLKKQKQKYQLQTRLQEPIIEKRYDTILFNPFYIIGKNKNKVDVYDFKLNKIKIPHLKNAYLKERWLEVLTKDEAKYIGRDLKTLRKIPQKFYTLCGTVPSIEIVIKNDSVYNNSYYLEHSNGYFSDRVIKHIKLNNILKTDSITFLDKSLNFYTDENDMFVETATVYSNLFRVKRNGKYGLLELNYDALTFNVSEYKKLNSTQPLLLPGKETLSIAKANLQTLLPFEFDDIYVNDNRLIFIEKNNKTGFLHNSKPILFDEFKKVTTSFFKITNNGKKGFVDVKQCKMYY